MCQRVAGSVAQVIGGVEAQKESEGTPLGQNGTEELQR
jgi:hypothetical protein